MKRYILLLLLVVVACAAQEAEHIVIGPSAPVVADVGFKHTGPTVAVHDRAFVPSILYIAHDGTVKWDNVGSEPHLLVIERESNRQPQIRYPLEEESVFHTFREIDTYTVKDERLGFTMTIIVE